MAVVTFSLFGFDTLASKLWAFSQMGLAKRHLRAIPGLRFFKLMGTGAGAGFSLRPDFGTYTLLCEWESVKEARERLSAAPVVRRYRNGAARTATLFLEPVNARGTWSGHAFGCAADGGESVAPVVALTRASIRPTALPRFWRRVPAISDAIEREAGKRFMIGTGELPWVHQVTVSVWDDPAAIRRFSLASAAHGEAVRSAYREGWFSEYCFVRFNMLAVEGAWPGLETVRPRVEDAASGGGGGTPDAFRHAAE